MDKSYNLYNSSNLQPSVALTQMIAGFRVTQLIYVAAELGIADLLKDGPKSADELAQLVGVNSETLYRVLCGLVSIGVFTQLENGHFGQAPIGQCLQSGAAGSLHSTALYWGQEWVQFFWGNILHTVKTGDVAFEHVFGMNFYEYLMQNSQASKLFGELLENRTMLLADAVVASYDFSPFHKIVGVGGGYGALVVPILKAVSQLNGIVFDLPSVSEAAKQYIEAAGLTKRCSVVSGNYFESVPGGGDVYILSEVIHCYDNSLSLTILRNCHQMMAQEGKLLLIEKVIPNSKELSFEIAIQNISMMIESGGQERTELEYRALLHEAGFALTRIIPTMSLVSVIEAIRMHTENK